MQPTNQPCVKYKMNETHRTIVQTFTNQMFKICEFKTKNKCLEQNHFCDVMSA